MLSRLPAVAQDVVVRASGIYQSVGKDGQPVEQALIANAVGQPKHSAGKPRSFNGYLAERKRTKDATE
jgi:hypothetical protein